MRFVRESMLCCYRLEHVALTGTAMPQTKPRIAYGLKAFRERRGYKTHLAFARAIGYKNRESVARWEGGKPISLRAVKIICDRFSCGEEEFMQRPLALLGITGSPGGGSVRP